MVWKKLKFDDDPPAAHESTHVSGGSDEIDSALGIAAMANLTQNKFWQGNASNRPVEVSAPAGAALDIVASDNLRNSNDTQKSTGSATYVKIKEVKLDTQFKGSIRIKFDLKGVEVGVNYYGKIYKNGVAMGTEQTTTGTIYETKSEDFSSIDWASGTLIQVYAHGTWGGGDFAYVKNMRFYYDYLNRVTNQDP